MSSRFTKKSLVNVPGQTGRLVGLPILLRRQADSRAVSSAALVGAAEAGCGAPRRGHEFRDGQSRVEELALEGSDVLLADELVIDRRNGVLPKLRPRNP